MSRLSKVQRQRRIAELLADEAVTSQEHLAELLAAAGIAVTQATVSRDLEDLGAVKVRVGGGASLYAIPDHPHEQVVPADHLRRVFGEWVLEASASANLVVVRTPPGSAHVVASAIDRSGLDIVLGSVAGDDTIIVVSAAHTTGEAVAEHFNDLAGLTGQNRSARGGSNHV